MVNEETMRRVLNKMVELVDEQIDELKEKQRAARIRADLASLVADSELSDEKKLDMILWINEELWNESQSSEEA
jgi:hypothetical protein